MRKGRAPESAAGEPDTPINFSRQETWGTEGKSAGGGRISVVPDEDGAAVRGCDDKVGVVWVEERDGVWMRKVMGAKKPDPGAAHSRTHSSARSSSPVPAVQWRPSAGAHCTTLERGREPPRTACSRSPRAATQPLGRYVSRPRFPVLPLIECHSLATYAPAHSTCGHLWPIGVGLNR